MTQQNLTARLIPIDRIRPDPAQPRKLLPPDLAEALAAGATPADVLDQLRTCADRDKWIRERLIELDALASSIAADGLMQPIRVIKAPLPTATAGPSAPIGNVDMTSVIRDGDSGFQIEAGERRWWAHCVLVQRGKTEFGNIAAFVVDNENESQGLLRRRVAENVLRSGFTAIELARAIATRLQEIVAAEPGIRRSEVERRVGSENGMSDRRVRHFVALLALSPEAQELAQQARLTENSLRNVVGIKEPARQLAAVRELTHPSTKKAISHKRSAAQKLQSNRGSHPRGPKHRKRAHGTTTSSASGKRLVGKSSDGLLHRDGKTTLLGIQRLLALAKTFKIKDSSWMNAEIWTKVLKKETDRHALSNLHAVLGRGLRIADRANAKSSDKR